MPLLVHDLRSDWHADLGAVAVRAVLQRAAAGTAAAALEQLTRAEPGEVAPVGVGHDDDVAAATAVTPVRAALRDVLFAAEREPAVAAATRPDADARAVVEHASVADGDGAAVAAARELDAAVALGEDR